MLRGCPQRTPSQVWLVGKLVSTSSPSLNLDSGNFSHERLCIKHATIIWPPTFHKIGMLHNKWANDVIGSHTF